MIKLKAFVKPEKKNIDDLSKKRVENESVIKLLEILKEEGADNIKMKKVPPPKWVEIEEEIVKGKIGSFCVVYYDELGESYDDDFALTLKDAIQIAYLECGVKPEDWRVVEE